MQYYMTNSHYFKTLTRRIILNNILESKNIYLLGSYFILILNINCMYNLGVKRANILIKKKSTVEEF